MNPAPDQTFESNDILLEAHALIGGARADAYGNASESMANIAQQWKLYLEQKYGVKITLLAEDVCWMMSDLKKIRQMRRASRENVLDAAGYLGLIERL